MAFQWATKQFKFVAGLLAFHVAFHTILRLSCRSVRYSLYYRADMDKVRDLSEARIKYAERVLERLGREGKRVGGERLGEEQDERCMTKFCIGVVGTEVRLGHRYLLNTVGSLTGIGEVGTDCRTETFFVQIRGNPVVPYHHQEGRSGEFENTEPLHADIKMMMDAGVDVDYFRPPGKGLGGGDGSQRGQKKWFSDETNDYRHAMERCLRESSASYVVIIEEDVFATKNFVGKLTKAVEFLEEKHRGEWSSLKLFVTDFWQNWERQTTDVVMLIVGGILFAAICELLMKLGKTFVLVMWLSAVDEEESLKRSSKDGSVIQIDIERGSRGPHWGRRSSGLVCDACRRIMWRKWFLRMYFVSLGVGTMYAVSKQALNLSQVSKRGIYANGFGSHTLGIVFPREVAKDIVPYLKRESKEPIDVLLLRFNQEVVEGGKKQFIIVPSLLQHTGMFSSSTRKVRFKETMTEDAFYRNKMKLASKFEDCSAEELWGLEVEGDGGRQY